MTKLSQTRAQTHAHMHISVECPVCQVERDAEKKIGGLCEREKICTPED